MRTIDGLTEAIEALTAVRDHRQGPATHEYLARLDRAYRASSRVTAALLMKLLPERRHETPKVPS